MLFRSRRHQNSPQLQVIKTARRLPALPGAAARRRLLPVPEEGQALPAAALLLPAVRPGFPVRRQSVHPAASARSLPWLSQNLDAPMYGEQKVRIRLTVPVLSTGV